MSERELAQLFGRATREMDARQRARIRQLRGIERELFEVLARRIVEELDRGRGTITTSRGSASIGTLIDAAFSSIERSGLKAFYKDAITDIFGIIGANDAYHIALAPTVRNLGDKRLKAMQKEVDRLMRRRMGIDGRGRAIEGGLIDSLTNSSEVRTRVKEVINAGAASGIPTGRLVRALEITLKGTRVDPGLLQRQFSPLIFDTYQYLDRASSDAYATKLGLDAFIYAGGLIETSRDFCIKRNGKVFSRKEAEREWPKDPTLPRTKKERESGVLVGYDPLRDMGRWNCRHRIRFISDALAEQLRPDLALKP